MKIIKAGLTILEAIALANAKAMATNRVHSVRRTKGTRERCSNISQIKIFVVHEGASMGSVNACYTARPENLRWKGEHGILV